MLDIEAALELMKKYGYSSTNSHPYLYQSGDTVGICYTYVDEEFGTLERIKIFDSLEAFEEFLKQIDWLKKNGLNYHVRMCLDNYEAINPKTLFLRNEKLMIEGEMDDIENFDLREEQRDSMDHASQILYEAGDLLLIYDEVKKRQLQYLLKIIGLKNQLRQKYFDLQKSVDEYNKVKIEREMVKIPEVPDNGGIDLQMEIALKDRYNVYIKEVPPLEEVTAFLKEVWDLNKALEMNTRYYDALREETEIRNEMKIVEKKQELMNNLNDNIKPLFGIDLVSRFKKINRQMGSTINSISKSIVEEKITQVEDKYKYYDKLDLLYVSDYLREAIQNSNYEDLSIKYGKGTTKELARRGRTPLNEVASSLLVQYKNSLSVDEQAILVIYSNPKFRRICDAILAIPKFDTFTTKQIIKKINNIKGFSKLKSECYMSLKNRINDPLNQTIKASIFPNYDFTSFETFIACLVKELVKLKHINNKMFLNGDINMYLPVKQVNDIKSKQFILVTNDISTLSIEAKENKNMIGITLLKENLPVLYSPYFLDLGDIYNKNASPKIEIREMINFELLIDVSDIIINIDKTKVNVINYYSELSVEGNVSIAKDIKSSGKTVFVKYAFLPNVQVLGTAPQQTVPTTEPATVPEMQPVFTAPETTPVTEPVTTPPAPQLAISTTENGVAAESVNLDQAVDNVLEKAMAAGSMVAIASQEVNQDAPVALETTVPETVPETEPASEETTPVTEPVVEETTPETEPVTEPFASLEKEIPEVNMVPETEPVKEEEKEPITEPETTPEEPVNPMDNVDENKDDDLDKLLDTLATTLPKDITSSLEDTNKMELFADLADKEEPKKEEPKEPVKTQIVKKIITKPDGTKKVVMVRRVVSADGKPIQPTGDGKQVKRIIKKVGQPGSVDGKKVIVRKVVKHAPTEEK